jgi:glycerophosphoryl diester phosphodiesterase
MAQYPENTLAAFRGAARVADMIELDVRRCGSGELVVFHDAKIDRVTDAVGEVADATYAELGRVSVLDSEERIPLLSEALEAIPSDVGVNIELKEADVAADAVDIADQHGHETLVSSFLPVAIAAARDVGAESLAYLFGGSEALAADSDSAAALDAAAELGCAYVHPDKQRCLDTDVVDDAHARGFAVNAWTATTAADVRALRERGVDGVILDDCGLTERCHE